MARSKNPGIRMDVRLPKDTRDRFIRFLHDHGLHGDGSVGKGLALLLDMANTSESGKHLEPDNLARGLTLAALLVALESAPKDCRTIRAVIEKSGVPWRTFVSDALIRKAERLLKREDKLEDVDLTDPTARSKVKGAAYARIHKTIGDLMAANAQALDMKGKRYVSKRLIERLSGIAPMTVRFYWRDHGEAIDAHNQAMGFRSAQEGRYHNQFVHRPDGSEEEYEKNLEKIG